MTLVSVVMAVKGDADAAPAKLPHQTLYDSLDSILAQTHTELECLLVADGPLSEQTRQHLIAWSARDPRLQVLDVPAGGLTRSLIHGCSRARGAFIARLDVGDAMTPTRLEHQLAVLNRHSDCVLATSDVEICGPEWEHLRTDSQPAATGEPLRVDCVPPEEGIAIDIPHHASVLFRRDAYEAVGGYREQFYFGQDWDLWYRLASVGSFVHLPEMLTRVRLFSDGLSSRHWREQRQIAQLSLACSVARRSGDDETPLLERAAAIRSKPARARASAFDQRRAEGAYFIAESLRRNGDRRCRRYFREALRHGFWKPRIWARSLMSITTGSGTRPESSK